MVSGMTLLDHGVSRPISSYHGVSLLAHPPTRSDRPSGPRAPPRLCQPGRPLEFASGLRGGPEEPLAPVKKNEFPPLKQSLRGLECLRDPPAWHRIFNDLVPLTHGGSSLSIFECGRQGLEVQQYSPYRSTVVELKRLALGASVSTLPNEAVIFWLGQWFWWEHPGAELGRFFASLLAVMGTWGGQPPSGVVGGGAAGHAAVPRPAVWR
jgi:hypothetical protein